MLWSYILSQFKEAALTLAGRDIYALCLSLGRLHSGEKMVKSVFVLNQFCDLCCRTIGLIYHELWEKEMATHLPGGSRGEGSLVGCCPWGRTESDTTEVT